MPWWRRIFGRGPATREAATSGGPFPPQWLHVLEESAPLYARLPRTDQAELRRLIRQFMGEKQFWGSRGLVVIDEMKLVVAAGACLLVLRLGRLGLYPQTKEVILYPSDFGEVTDAIGPDGEKYVIRDVRAGEASRRGPILLAWDDVEHSTRDRYSGHNTVLHEFAHALDFLDGEANGTPPLEKKEHYEDWTRVMTAEHRELIAAAARGRRTLLDPYGASNPAEFFAVATEHFFEQPRRLARARPALYGQLRRFYQQDPASWR